MAIPYDPISTISTLKDQWNLHVRIIRMYSVPDQYNDSSVPFSVELVIQDEAGDRIQASIRKTLIYKFEKLLKEGEAYHMYLFGVAPSTNTPKLADSKFRLNFQYHTEVKPLKSSLIPSVADNFKSIAVLLAPGFNENVLVDVMAVLTGVGTEREVGQGENKSKMIKLGLSVRGFKLECALFGPYVDDVHSFVSSGNVCNSVIGIQFAKMKSYRGKVGLQNVYHTTKLWFNLQTPEAVELRKSFLETNECVSQTLTQIPDFSPPAVDEDFFVKGLAKTIQEIKDFKQDCTSVVLATVTHIIETTNWWYMSCKTCNKSVYADSSMYYCDSCVRHVVAVTPRYRLKIRVMDDTDSITFVLFDHQATELLGKSCADMIEILQQSNILLEVPEEIKKLVGQTFLIKNEFKTSKNPKFGPSYCVRRLTSDPAVLSKFKNDFQNKSSASVLPSQSDMKSLSFDQPSDEMLPKDLSENVESSKLTQNEMSITSGKRSSEETIDLSIDEVVCSTINKSSEIAAGLGDHSSSFSGELTPTRNNPNSEIEGSIMDSYSCTLKKKIKVEKD